MFKAMKLFWLFNLLCILAALTVFAGEKVYYDEVTAHGSSILVANDSYLFTINAAGLSSFSSQTTGGLIVYNNTCEDHGLLQFCVSEAQVDYKNFTLDKDYFKARVKIYKKTAEVDLAREFEPDDLITDKKSYVLATLENTGDEHATNIVFKDPYKNFTISIIHGDCTLSGDTIVWKTALFPGKKQTCRYAVTPLFTGSFTSIAQLTYFDGVATVNETDKKTFDVQQSLLDVAYGTSKRIIALGEQFNISVNLTNNENSVFSGSSSVSIPIGFTVVDKSRGLQYQGSTLAWKGALNPDDTVTYNATIQAGRIGAYNIKLENSFYYEYELTSAVTQILLTVILDNVTVVTNLKSSYHSGENMNFFLNVKNPSKRYHYYDAQITAKSDLTQVHAEKQGDLMKGNYIELLNTNLLAPVVTKKTVFPITVDIEYKTDAGQIVEQHETVKVTVLPLGQEEEETLPEEVIEETPIEPVQQPQPSSADVKEPFFKNPMMLFIDGVIVLLIIVFVMMLFGRKRKVNVNKIFVDDDTKQNLEKSVGKKP